jgi:hypothetical protein
MSIRSSAPLRPFTADAGLNAAERRSYPRYALDLPGRFMRSDKLDYPCRLKDISIVGAAMTTPAILTVGEKLIVYLLHLGGLEGSVVRRFEGGFAMSITATQRKREKLANQILRLSRQGVIPEAEEREHPREPASEIVVLKLFDGAVMECPLLDISRSGASLVTPIRPPIGTLVLVADRRAAIVRHHDQGIAVEFLNELDEGEPLSGPIARGNGLQ